MALLLAGSRRALRSRLQWLTSGEAPDGDGDTNKRGVKRRGAAPPASNATVIVRG